MATITTVALQERDTKRFVGAITPVVLNFDCTTIAATVTNGDRIQLMTLPENAQIIGAQVRLTGTSGATSITYLSVVGPTGDVQALTPTSGAPAAPSVAYSTIMSQQHKVISVTGTRTVNLEVTTGTFSVTNGLSYQIGVQYAAYP